MILSNVSFFSNIFDDRNKKSLEYAFVQNMLRDDIIHILPKTDHLRTLIYLLLLIRHALIAIVRTQNGVQQI